ncbi:hypothetical protein GCM10009645_05180 [Mycolicibacterium poriferae]
MSGSAISVSNATTPANPGAKSFGTAVMGWILAPGFFGGANGPISWAGLSRVSWAGLSPASVAGAEPRLRRSARRNVVP